MRQSDLPRVVTALERPIHDFIRESRVRIALLINSARPVIDEEYAASPAPRLLASAD